MPSANRSICAVRIWASIRSTQIADTRSSGDVNELGTSWRAPHGLSVVGGQQHGSQQKTEEISEHIHWGGVEEVGDEGMGMEVWVWVWSI